MKMDILKKAAALILSGAMLTVSTHIPSHFMASDAAANKARVSVHDPSIIKDGNTYYIFGSHIEAANLTTSRTGHVFQMDMPERIMWSSVICRKI